MQTLSDIISIEKLIVLFREKLNSANSINNTLIEIDYTNNSVSIPMLSPNPLKISFPQKDFQKQIAECGYEDLQQFVQPYKQHEITFMGQWWNRDSFFEKARGIPFALCFYLLALYYNRIPTAMDFIWFFKMVACKEISQNMYQYLNIKGVREPERKTSKLPTETPFSIYDIGVRAYNLFGNDIREISSAVNIDERIKELQETNPKFQKYKFQVLYNSKYDIYKDCDLYIKVTSPQNTVRIVSLSLFDNTSRGKQKRKEKENNNMKFQNLKCDMRIKLSADIKDNQNAMDEIAGIYVYNQQVINIICDALIKDDMMGDYQLWGDLTLEKI